MASTRTIADCTNLLVACAYPNGPVPGGSEVAAKMALWLDMFGDVEDAALSEALKAYIKTGEFWPAPGAIRKLLPNPTVIADQEAMETAFYGARWSLPEHYRRALVIADVPSAFTIRRMDAADVATLRKRFLAACTTPEVKALAKNPTPVPQVERPVLPAPASKPVPQIAATAIPVSARAAPAVEATTRPVAPAKPEPPAPDPTPKREWVNPDDISEAECLKRRPRLEMARGTPAWQSSLRNTQVLIAEGRL